METRHNHYAFNGCFISYAGDIKEIREDMIKFFDVFEKNKLSKTYMFTNELVGHTSEEFIKDVVEYEWYVSIERQDGKILEGEEFNEIQKMFSYIED